MDFMKAVTYPFDDEDWLKKVGIAVVLQFIPLVGQLALQGWMFRTAQNVKNNDPTPLPEWSDFGDKIMKGLMLMLAALIYQAPTVLFICIASFAPTIAAAGGDNEDLVAALGTVGLIVAACCFCLVLIYAIVAGLAYLAGSVRYLESEEFGTFFQFGDNISLMRENIGSFLMYIVWVFAASFVASLAGSITLGIGYLLVTPFMTWFSGHMLGQLAQQLGGASSGPAADVAPAV